MSEPLVKYQPEEECRKAIRDVKNDKSNIDWCILTYVGKSGADAQTLKVLSTGSGGLESLKAHLTPDIAAYCLLRQTDQIDDSVTVKFVFINWVGDQVPRMQRARISVHLPIVKEFFGPFHVDFAITNLNELTQEVLTAKIMDTSGSGSRVLDDKKQQKQLDIQAGSRTNVSSTRTGEGKVGPQEGPVFSNPEELKAILKEVRTDGNPTDWVLFGYENPQSNTIVLLGKGSGGVAEMRQHLRDDIVAYGLVKKVERIDESNTLRFCFVYWLGERVPRMQRARISTHRGTVLDFFAPFHVDLSPTRIDEISDEIVKGLISRTVGTESRVLETTIPSERVVATRGSASHQSPVSQSAPSQPQDTVKPVHKLGEKRETPIKKTVVPGVPTEKRDIILADEEGIRNAIKNVRNDSGGNNWVLVTYDAPKSKTLVLLGTGSGGLKELVSHLKDDIVAYGLYRTTEKIDDSVTVKFCFIDWVGEKINRMQRAVLGTHSGAVKELFHPYHVDIYPTKLDEVTEEIIVTKIKNAAGTAVHVL